MDSNVQTICLIALGVGFLILIAAALLLSVLRGSVFGLGMMVMRMISEPQKEETTVDLTNVRTQSASDDLRARAQSLDFDATVAQYRQNEAAAQSAPDSPFNNPPAIPPPNPATQGFPPPNTPRPKDDGPLRRS
jgi:hypothetical protein